MIRWTALVEADLIGDILLVARLRALERPKRPAVTPMT
jgi:hypothetical protein